MAEDMIIMSPSNRENMAVKVAQLEDQLKRERLNYDSIIQDLQRKLANNTVITIYLNISLTFLKNSASSSDLSLAKAKEIEDINQNLSAQISEYNKLIKRLYEDNGGKVRFIVILCLVNRMRILKRRECWKI